MEKNRSGIVKLFPNLRTKVVPSETSNEIRSFHLLPYSEGSISEILYHHEPFRLNNNLVDDGIFRNFLKRLTQTGVKPKVAVIATYVDSEERQFLTKVADSWYDFVEHLEYIDLKVPPEFREQIVYAQDTCIALSSQRPLAILSHSKRYLKSGEFMSKLEELLSRCGIQIIQVETIYSLEGGHVFPTSKLVFISDPDDRKIIKYFKQEALFVQSLLCKLYLPVYLMLNTNLDVDDIDAEWCEGQDHVDLILSVLEREDSFDVFYAEFQRTFDFFEGDTGHIYSSNSAYIQQFFAHFFDEYDQQMNRLIKQIRSKVKDAKFHRMPSIVGFKKSSENFWMPYVYSGANLLFHSTHEKDYAFYLEYAQEIDGATRPINKELEKNLKNAGIAPVPISGDVEMVNYYHTLRGAGLRCLVKVLTRNAKSEERVANR